MCTRLFQMLTRLRGATPARAGSPAAVPVLDATDRAIGRSFDHVCPRCGAADTSDPWMIPGQHRGCNVCRQEFTADGRLVAVSRILEEAYWDRVRAARSGAGAHAG